MPDTGVDEGRGTHGFAGAFDAGALARLVGDDPALTLEILACFDVFAAGARADLVRAARDGDAGGAALLGHSLKSSARSVGAFPLGGLCARLEAAADARCEAGFVPLVDEVVEALDAALAAMRAWRRAREATVAGETEYAR